MMNIDATNLYQVRHTGIHILNRELGPAAMIRFLQQYDSGYGDFSKERHERIDKVSVADIAAQIREKRNCSGA